MTEDHMELLATLGQVEPPTHTARDRAREALWAAVADEMISGDATTDSETTRSQTADSSERRDHRRRAGPAS